MILKYDPDDTKAAVREQIERSFPNHLLEDLDHDYTSRGYTATLVPKVEPKEAPAKEKVPA